MLTRLWVAPLRCQWANSWAGIKPTALLSAFDKENLIEFLLDFLHYLYNYYMVCALLSHAYHVTYHVTSMWYDGVTSCHVTVTMWHLWHDTFPHFLLCSKSKIKGKKKKKNINNDLAILLSYNRMYLYCTRQFLFYCIWWYNFLDFVRPNKPLCQFLCSFTDHLIL